MIPLRLAVVATLGIHGLLVAPIASACAGDPDDLFASPVIPEKGSIITAAVSDGFVARINGFGTDDSNQPVLPSVDVPYTVQSKPTTPFAEDGGVLVFLEPVGTTQRVCREERWERSADGAVATKAGKGASNQDAALQKVTHGYSLVAVRAYRYDPAGRLLEVRDVVSAQESPSATPAWLAPQPGLVFCARYDQQGRMLWSSDSLKSARPASAEVQCADFSEDNADSRRVVYAEDGSVQALLDTTSSPLPEGSMVALVSPDGYDDSGWGGKATFLLPPKKGVEAILNRVDARIAQGRGLASLYTSLESFAADDAQPLYLQRPQAGSRFAPKVYYEFPEGEVPLSAAATGFSALADHPRIRSYDYGTEARVGEVFGAHSHVMKQRIWRSRFARRQEDYDAAGRLRQVAQYGQASPQTYAEDLHAAGRNAGFKPGLLDTEYRVYRVDRKGREALVFACWAGGADADGSPRQTQCGGPDGNVLATGSRDIEALLQQTYGWSVRRLIYSPF